jgi:predicted RecA/RadA family phage recombinase
MAISENLAKFRKTGETIDYKPGSATPAGSIVKVGGLFGLALWDIAANENGTLKVLHRGDVVEVTTDDALGSTNAGVAIYIVDATGLVSKTSTNATLLGYTRAAVGSTDLSFEVVCA